MNIAIIENIDFIDSLLAKIYCLYMIKLYFPFIFIQHDFSKTCCLTWLHTDKGNYKQDKK